MFGKSEHPSDYQKTRRAIVALAIDHDASCHRPRHQHRRAQLIYALRGVITVSTPSGRWVVPSSRAVWMPAGMEHATAMPGKVSMRTVYFEPDIVKALPREVRVVEVTPLLRELILEAVRIPNNYKPASRDARLMELIADEIRVMDALPFDLPLPRDSRALVVTNRILAQLDCPWRVDRWAREIGVGTRTLARLFERETGLSFGRWRQQARLQASLTRLAAGQGVLQTGLEVGYDSPSAFAQAFRRAFGVPPTHYFAPADDQRSSRLSRSRASENAAVRYR